MSSPAAAQRVAGTIRTVKWVVIAFMLLVAVVSMLAGASDGMPVYAVMGVLTSVLAAVVTWVMFGWFEHTLSMLSQVALNTSPAAAPFSPAL